MTRQRIFGIAANVFFLGLVSLLNDMSSEMIFTLLPLFLANVLGAAPTIIGLVEGVAESTASFLRIGSGWLSDKIGRRKLLAFSGYTLSTVMKPLMYIATSWGLVLGVRFTDRIGKGIRSAPRDALVADSLEKHERGKGFGFHRAMDTGGAMLGITGAALIIFLLQQNSLLLERSTYQMLVVIGVIPAVLALCMFIFVKEKRREDPTLPVPSSPAPTAVTAGTGLGRKFWTFISVMFLFTLGNSSDAFLVLRAQDLQNTTLTIMLMLILFNAVYAGLSVPFGVLSDKLGRKGVIIIGWLVFAAVRLGFTAATAHWHVWLLFAAWGLYYALTEGVARAFVADLVPSKRRGTAYGIYYAALGIGLLPASVIAGWLWQTFTPAAPFAFSSALAVLSIIGLAVFVRK
ncbi:MAG: MFS transporter [Chloroflexota bacterium]